MIEAVIDASPRDLGGLSVGRVLPTRGRRRVGPFTFLDHMGPKNFGPGEGIDVPPHPHIGLATVTYLFEGELLHRDSLGSQQTIRPGDINWMTAGSGIVHSERTPPERRQSGERLHGLQIWVALPTPCEETEPEFYHHPRESLPTLQRSGGTLRVLAGSAYGETSPVRVFSSMFYVDVALAAGSEIPLPVEHAERAVYVVDGVVACGAERAERGRMLVFTPGVEVTLRAEQPARVVLLGGEALEGERHMFWNFVSSSKARIERAKLDWNEGRFAAVPGDDGQSAPLPSAGPRI